MTMEPGREMDARVGELMGLAVCGMALVYEDEMSCWNIERPDTEQAAYQELRPVWVQHQNLVKDGPFTDKWDDDDPDTEPEWFQRDQGKTREQFRLDVETWGHPRYALDVVPYYSTDIAAAWEVVEAMLREKFSVRMAFEAALRDVVRVEDVPIAWPYALFHLKPVHICLAALQAVGK